MSRRCPRRTGIQSMARTPICVTTLTPVHSSSPTPSSAHPPSWRRDPRAVVCPSSERRRLRTPDLASYPRRLPSYPRGDSATAQAAQLPARRPCPGSRRRSPRRRTGGREGRTRARQRITVHLPYKVWPAGGGCRDDGEVRGCRDDGGGKGCRHHWGRDGGGGAAGTMVGAPCPDLQARNTASSATPTAMAPTPATWMRLSRSRNSTQAATAAMAANSEPSTDAMAIPCSDATV